MASGRVITVRASSARVRAILARLPKAVSSSAARSLLVRLGLTALSKIKQAFRVKAAGGTDECGERWAPLAPSTVAYSRRHPGIPKRRPFWQTHPSVTASSQQRKRWWQLYRQFLGRYHGNKHRAAAHAWLVLKSEGANPTLMDRFGMTRVQILRDTGLLYNSLSPAIVVGAQAPPVPPPRMPHQVFRLLHGEVAVGTNRKWAGTHHRGTGRIPQRRLWPEPSRWRSSWWAAFQEQASLGMMDLIIFLLRSA